MTPDPRRTGPAMRVMSYNVRDFLDDVAAAARVVRAVDPDVLCLQEVPRRLTTELRLPAFARACRLWWSGGRRGTGGTAILTSPRVTVHSASRHRLGVRFPDRTRGYAAADVSLPGSVPVSVASIHLSLRADERERHARDIVAALGDRSVVAGDLNEGSDGRGHRLIAERCRVVSEAVPTFPASSPDQVLDVIFAGPGLEVRPATAVALAEEDLVAASDHRPVWVDLVTAPQEGGRAAYGRS
ncbi:endonuclease/exonuclease/phosphatase [Intrasporangium oryzae NRRL B-24470]|uniref:Endonuclease/exonuclease/phosphatase n=1 Tax=Intrasporangium oryzae NRRL B-24470 TaxID=1386089 RepID=W9G1L2_9MICO|nr:endonuclease/exonuclease/phosphatase family protein [Intrasporangium oryzae]EWS99980.1 endonuclease/exonuclease/phosphatase [Intrasporangium oryzae NRRL B-24470]